MDSTAKYYVSARVPVPSKTGQLKEPKQKQKQGPFITHDSAGLVRTFSEYVGKKLSPDFCIIWKNDRVHIKILANTVSQISH